MPEYPNKMVKNRPSPENEKDYIDAYKKLNKAANKPDEYDISAVTAKDGTRGHVQLPQGINRGKDSSYHRGKGFIPDAELRKQMKK